MPVACAYPGTGMLATRGCAAQARAPIVACTPDQGTVHRPLAHRISRLPQPGGRWSDGPWQPKLPPMTERIKAGQQARQERLEAALRENLQRRKAQARRRASATEKGGAERPGDGEVKGEERS